MTDHDELIAKIAKCEARIEELEKQLKENTEKDEKRHKEFIEQQKKHHGETMVWNKAGGIGGIITAIAGILGVIAWIIKLFKGDEKKTDKPDLW